MTGHEIRTKFLEFFKSKGHKVAASDSLVPKDDPTVLFTTAGMQQFKPQFMGHLTGFTRAASSQKCLRTDDLPEVGVTDFHHTMFEMLGNFSFGDYFKREAITWAWEFLTQVMGIAPDKLWVSVNKDDDEAYQIWLNEIKVPAQRIVKLGDKSNFWPSNARLNGPNGPCGPCSEIFFDWGKNDCNNPDCNPDCSCGRFCEVWNLVFTQFNRKDGGVLEPLPAKNIDTGMGLERLTAVMQGKRNNFESDLFQPILSAIDQALAAEGATVTLREKRVIADHIRAVTFGLADGVVPSNEGRGYVMRRLIVDMTNILIQAGVKKPLVHTFVSAVVGVMQGPYTELVGKEKGIVDLLKRVEEAVIKVNAEKVPALDEELQNISLTGYDKTKAETFLASIGGIVHGKAPDVLGNIIFKYRDTYGLSLDLICEKVEARFGKVVLDSARVEADKLMAEQRERSRAGSKMQGDVFLSGDVDVKDLPKTIFLGYDQPSADVTVKALFVNGQKVAEAKDGDNVAVILDQTPFYAEQGGQCADIGFLQAKGGTVEVKDTQKQSDVYIHRGVVTGVLKAGEMVKASIDGERRMAVMRNHTATHLLQAALRQVLGEHVKQQGSAVDQERLRFDFTQPKAVSKDELERIEDAVNSFIRRCDKVEKKEMTIEEAKQSGALAFFAEKYGETVRVVSVGDYSREFCGGTHLNSAGQIGLFKIVSEGAVAQGIRRIEAVTGTGALVFVRAKEKQLEKAAAAVKSPVEELVTRVEAQARRVKELEKTVGDLNFEVIKNSIDELLERYDNVSGVHFVAQLFRDSDIETLRRVADLIKQKCPTVVALLAATTAQDGALIIAISDDLVAKGLKAGDIVKKVTPLFEGSGGGRPNLAQAGCKSPEKLSGAFENIKGLVKESIRI
ncbi:MAG: alanine--tRNA ligase [Candidatus Omnitrophica bacterium]|nr:alanine--tRNA ligase [Candidatus Omnitrophota bacterium]